MNKAKKGIKIGLVIGDVIFRNGIASFISQHESLEVAFETDTITDLELLLQKNEDTNICIADLHLHHEDTAQYLFMFGKAAPSLKFILFSNTNHPYNVRKATAIGCKGIINKYAHATTLIKAILSVHFTGSFYEKSCPTNEFADSRNELITDQESKVLKSLCSNKSNTEISADLDMGPSIVNAYKNLLFRKLHVTSREMLIKCAYSLGLIES